MISCGSHNSAGHQHLRPSHASAVIDASDLDSSEAVISVTSEAANQQTKKRELHFNKFQFKISLLIS